MVEEREGGYESRQCGGWEGRRRLIRKTGNHGGER